MAGFHISELYSPWSSISSIVKKHLEAKRGGDQQLKVWTNTCLGLPFSESVEQTPVKNLLSRVEDFSLDRIPDEVVYLTLGGDTQDDREELTIIGWSLKKEAYVLGHLVIPGNTNQSEVWQEVEKFLEKDYFKKDGTLLKISSSCFDSGGHSTLQVYEFALQQTKKGKKVYAIKGREGNGPIWEYKTRSSKTYGVHRYHSIGTGTSKDDLFNRLKLTIPGENYIHFAHTLDANYFSQLTADVPKWEIVRGKPRKVWVQQTGTRRESADCFRYRPSSIVCKHSIL